MASLFDVSLGIPTALVFFAAGGKLHSAYGTVPLLVGIAIATVLVSFIGYILTSFSSLSGLDSDLMSICTGFGRRGSAVTSLIYSLNFMMFFALEEVIMLDAIRSYWGSLPPWTILIILGLVMVGLSWYGMAVLNVLMWVTLPVFVICLAWTVFAAGRLPTPVPFLATSAVSDTGDSWVSAIAVVHVVGALLAFVVNATVGADVGRFIPVSQRRAGAVLVGVVLQVLCFFGSTLLGAWLSHRLGGETNPGHYFVSAIGIYGVLFVAITQIRINAINVYSGSLALSNFFARALGVTPGRHIWAVATVVIGTLVSITGIYANLLEVLTFESIFVMAWVMTIIGNIWKSNLLRRDVPFVCEIALQPAVQWGGIGALTAGLVVSMPLAFGLGGPLGRSCAPVVSGLVALGVSLSLSGQTPPRQ